MEFYMKEVQLIIVLSDNPVVSEMYTVMHIPAAVSLMFCAVLWSKLCMHSFNRNWDLTDTGILASHS